MNTSLMDRHGRKKTGPKPIYGEAKKMVSFRLSPEALEIIKQIADKDALSQAEVLERWARQYKDAPVNNPAISSTMSIQRDISAAERN